MPKNENSCIFYLSCFLSEVCAQTVCRGCKWHSFKSAKKKTKNRYREIGLYNLKILCISAHAHLCFQQQQPAVFSEKALIILLHTTVQYLLCTKQQSDPERDRVVNMVERWSAKETDTLSGVGGDQVKINMTSNNCCSMSVGK